MVKQSLEAQEEKSFPLGKKENLKLLLATFRLENKVLCDLKLRLSKKIEVTILFKS